MTKYKTDLYDLYFHTKYNNTECGYNKKFEYNVYINGEGINGLTLDYAASMCKHKWGWWFNDDKMAYMSFEDPGELTMWTLACYHKQHRE